MRKRERGETRLPTACWVSPRLNNKKGGGMIPWWVTLISGFVGFLAGAISLALFIVAGEEPKE